MTASHVSEMAMLTYRRAILCTVLAHLAAGSVFGWLSLSTWAWSLWGVKATLVDKIASYIGMSYLPPILPAAFLITKGLLFRPTPSLAATAVYGLLLTSAQALTFLALWAQGGGAVVEELVWWAIIYSMAGGALGPLTNRGCRYVWSKWDRRKPRRGFPVICDSSQTDAARASSKECAGAASGQAPEASGSAERPGDPDQAGGDSGQR